MFLLPDICHRQEWLHSITVSTPDSLLDLMAGGILWFTHLSMETIDIYKYPIGKLRVQPVGIIIFPAIMATLGELSLQFSALLLCTYIIWIY